MADQDKPLQFIKGGKIQTGRIAQQLTPPVAAPETEPQEQPIVPTVLPSQAPIWRDANGNLSYNQPDSYNWFSSFVDRRLYAQTGGGAGYWMGGRTPTRIFYEWSIGDFQGSERDQKWIDDTTNPEFVSNWANTIRSQIGPSEQILIEDYGQTVLEDMVKTSVSSNNLSAKLAFALDAAESKRRIEAYDTTTSWGGYIGTKTLSAVGNYMAVDPVTTTTTIASLGTGTLLPAAARSTFIASRLPWLTTPLQASKTWFATHATTLARANFAFNATDGALSGYAYHLGYNRDLSILGNTSLLDTNPIDDIAIGGTIGLLGGWMGYHMNLKQISRNAAIESVAQTLGSIPHEFAVDYATRYVMQHGELLRAARRSGIDVTSDIYRKIQDPTFLRNAGFRSPEEVFELMSIVRNDKPTTKEFAQLIDSKLVDETNDTIDYFNYLRSTIRDMNNKGKNIGKKVNGKVLLDFEGNRAELIAALRNGDKVNAGTTQRLTEMGFSDVDIQKIYGFIESRSGIDEFDFHEWLWSRNSNRPSLTQDIKLLLKYADDVETNELNAIRKHFPSQVPEPNAAGKRFLVTQHGEGRTVEGVLNDISTGQKKVLNDVKFEEGGGFYLPSKVERPNHILEDDIELGSKMPETDSDEAFKMYQREGEIAQFAETTKAEVKGLFQRVANRLQALNNMPDKDGAAFMFGVANMRQVNKKLLRLQAVAKGVGIRVKELTTRTAGMTPIEVKKELDILRKQINDVRDEFKAITESIENPEKLSKESRKKLAGLVWEEFDKMITDLPLKDKFFIKLGQIVDIAKMNLKALDVKARDQIRKLIGIEFERATIAPEPHAILINKDIDALFNRLATQFDEVLDARESKLLGQYYNNTNGFFSLDFLKRAFTDPKLQKLVGELQEKVDAFRRVITTNGEFENNFTRQGIDTADGYPVARLEAFVNSTDDDVIAAYNKLLKDIDAIKAKMGNDAMNPIFVERLELLVKQRLLKNDLLRTRLKDGILGEQLGILNTRASALNMDARLIDGAIPFRSRNSFGTPDAPILSSVERNIKDDLTDFMEGNKDLDEMADLPDDLDAMANQRVVESVSYADKQAANALKVNERLTDRFSTHIRMSKRENPYKGTKFNKTIADYHNAASRNDALLELQLAVSTVKLKRVGMADADNISINDLLTEIGGELQPSKDGTSFKLIVADADVEIGDIPTSLLDDFGNVKTDVLDTLVAESNELRKRTRERMDDLLKEGKISKAQYNNFIAQSNVGNGGWSFAAANAAVVGLRQIPYVGNGLVRLAEYAMTKSMDLQGSNATRLWFNRDFRRRYRGMNAFEQVLMFANLVDSPHTLKRDFGNIIDLNMFSAQQLRNNNARQANRVITVYRDLHSRHGLTPLDNETVIQALISGDTSNLTPIQRQLYDVTFGFFTWFQDDATDIIFRGQTGNVTAAMNRTLGNLIRDNVIIFDTARIVTNRNAIRTRITDNFNRYVRENLDTLRTGNSAMISPALRQQIMNAGNTSPIDNLIAAATDPYEIMLLLTNRRGAQTRQFFGITELVDELTDTQVQSMRSLDDLVNTLESIHASNSPTNRTNVGRLIEETTESFLERMDRTRRFSSSRNRQHNTPTHNMAGLNYQSPINDIFREMMSEPDLRQFQIRNIADLVVDYAANDGLNLRMQAQVSREIGDVNIFQVFNHARDHLRDVARQAERDGLSNAMRNAEDTLNALEDRMAHALGFQLEANPRQGWLEAAFRQQNGMIRASVGSFWGLQTAIAEIPKSIILNAQRNGIVNSIIDLMAAIKNKDDLDDLGYALEQYTQKYALGIDNEAYAGRVQINRAAPISGAPTTGINLNPVPPIRRTFDLLAGRQVDPSGATITVAQKEGNRLETGLARAADATVGLTESLANTNSRLGGQQWFLAVGRDMAVRKGKRQIVDNIDRLIRFSDEFATSNFDQITDFNQRLAAFKRLAKKHNLDWDFVVRMNHHGLLDKTDLTILRRAFGSKRVVPKAKKLMGVELSGGGRGVYKLPELLDELDSIATATSTITRRDEIAAKLTSFLDEEVNSAMNTASLIGSNPNANIVQRWLFQFSNYARGFQHQTIMRGANDSTIAKAVGMLIPVIIGEMVYNNVRRAIEGQARGEKTMEQAKSELAAKLHQNPELVIYETLSRVPVGGGLQSFLANSVVNPLAMETKAGREVRDYVMEKTHSGIYDSVDFGVGVVNERLKTQIQTNDLVSPQPNMNNVYLPSFYPWDFKPYTDGFKFVNELVSDNPYRNEEREFFDVPTGRVYSMVPGVRTWQFQLGLRLMGYPAQSDNIRAKKFSKQ